MVRQAVLREHVATTEQVGRVRRPGPGRRHAARTGRERRAWAAARRWPRRWPTASPTPSPSRTRPARPAAPVPRHRRRRRPAAHGRPRHRAGRCGGRAGRGRPRLARPRCWAGPPSSGLLTDYGGGYYGIHPALPWFFTDLFTHHTPRRRPHAERAYAHAYAALGDYYFDQVEQGRAADVLPALRAEEANLLHALHLARTHHLPDAALGCLQGLRQLYELTGRAAEWARLVADIQGDYIDPATDQPRPRPRRRLQHRHRIPGPDRPGPAGLAHRHPPADHPHRLEPGPGRPLPRPARRAARRHRPPPAARPRRQRAALGQLLLRAGRPGLPATTTRPPTTSPSGSATPPARPSPRPTSATPTWPCPGCGTSTRPSTGTNASLDLKPEHDRIGRAAAHDSLANVAYERFLDARAAGAPAEQLLAHLEQARTGYQQALDLLPDDHHEYRATAHNQLGNIYADVGDVPAGAWPLPAGHPPRRSPRRHLRRRTHPLQHRPAPRRQRPRRRRPALRPRRPRQLPAGRTRRRSRGRTRRGAHPTSCEAAVRLAAPPS